MHSQSDPSAALRLEEVTKIYPDRTDDDGNPIPSVNNVSLTVERGQIFGLLGPNGAGKSTTIRMIATLLEPTSGTITVCGHDTAREPRKVRRLLGVALGGERSVYWKLTARQNLEYFAALHGSSRRSSRARIQQLLEEVQLADRADDYVERYSTGMRQRLVIARALLNDPQLLLLDEPTSGLDPHASASLHEQVLRLKATGHTIILTTHDMAEADRLSDRLGIIDRGKLIAEGTAQELKDKVGAAQVIRVRVRLAAGTEVGPLVADLGSADVLSASDDLVELAVRTDLGDELMAWLVATAGRHHATVLRAESEAVNLRDAFLTLTGRELTHEPADE